MTKTPELLKGQTIQDATAAIVLTIKNEDIQQAIRLDPYNCVAAKALTRQLKAVSVCVMRARTYINYGTKKKPAWARYITPPSLAREVVALDRGGKCAAGVYTIIPPTPSQKLGNQRGDKSKARDPSAKPRAHRHITANIRD